MSYVLHMRWDNLFDDLESQLEAELEADDVGLRVEEERLRLARLGLRDRLVAIATDTLGSDVPVRLLLGDRRSLDVHFITLGRDWASVNRIGGPSSYCLVPFAAISGIVLMRAQVQSSLASPAAPDTLASRLGFGYMLRDLCRRRTAVEIVQSRGEAIHGTIDRVGRDHLDLAVHEAGIARRERDVAHIRIVPFDVIETVRAAV
ncbi:hypothetical protein [Homoserinimonas hongtaonis]|nr:hypothetical protein [Salinibacterium hongtaonis]